MMAPAGAVNRKRPADQDDESCRVRSHDQSAKRQKGVGLQDSGAVQHALLVQFYPKIQTLRDYLLEKLPSTSRLRRKKIASFPSIDDARQSEVDRRLARLLDLALVGSHCKEPDKVQQHNDRWEKWISYSQTGDDSRVTLSDGLSGSRFSQSEV
jgi:telomerase reverse transcriptase